MKKININNILKISAVLTLLVFALVYKVTITDALISNGANAVDMIGEFDDTSTTAPVPLYTKRGSHNSPNQYGLSNPRNVSVDTVNHRLFVADSGNLRVMVYNLNASNQLVDRVADFVIGQPNFHTTNSNTTQNGLRSVLYDIAFDDVNNRLFVLDSARVLVYDTTTISNGMNASYVIGQPDFITNNGTQSQKDLSNVDSIELDKNNNRLFVGTDNGSGVGRVLVFDVTPGTMSNYPDAIGILGQADFTTFVGANSASKFSPAKDMSYDSDNDWLFLVDRNKNRVLVFDVATTTPNESAIYVLGQTNFTSITSGLTDSKFNNPEGVAIDTVNDRLFVADDNNERVLVFDINPGTISNGENASNVLGQADFISNVSTTTQNSVDGSGLYYDSSTQYLYASDRSYNRVIIFDVATVTDNENAINLLGQSDGTSNLSGVNYTKSASHDGNNLWGFGAVYTAAYDTVNHKLFVSDNNMNRIVVYNLNSNNTLIDRIPDYVIGSNSFSGTGPGGASVNTLNGTYGVAVDNRNNFLYVADTTNNRIMVYDLGAIATNMNASYVLGQPNFTSNSSATTQSGMSSPNDVTYDPDNNRLFVGDGGNSRVLVYDMSAISNGMNAIYVIGQPDFVTSGGALSQSKFGGVGGLTYAKTINKLYIADSSYNRVLEYDVATSTIANGMNATHVLGQPDFVTGNSGTTQNDLSGVTGLTYDATTGRLFVTDSGNNRIVTYNVGYGVTDYMAQSNVIGQPDFISSGSSVSQSTFDYPTYVTYDAIAGIAAIVDDGNNRVMLFDASSTPVTVPITMGTGTDGAEPGTAGNFVINTVSTSTAYYIYFTLSGSATNGTDYTTIPLSIFVPPNTSSVNIPVSVLSDSLTEGPETVTLTLASTSFFAVAPGTSNFSTTINITDSATSGGGGSSSGGGSVVVPVQQSYTGNTYVQSTTTTSTGGSIVSNPASISNYNTLFKANNLPDLIGGAEPGVTKEFSNYVCQRYLREYILPGQKNNPSEVKKLQIFLNENEGEKLAVDGTYDADDISAVKKFQAKYLDQIMAPWGADAPTGRVFRTTTAKINLLMCAKQRGCPYFKEYLTKGDESLEAVKVQDFLNVIFAPTSGYPNNALPLVKEYDSPTKATVENFQNVYKEIVLKPWELVSATGRWYQTTRHAANKLMNCDEGEIQLENGKSFR